MFVKRGKFTVVFSLALALIICASCCAVASQAKGTTRVALEVKKQTLTIGDVYEVPWTVEFDGEADAVSLKSSKPSVANVLSDR